MKTNFTVAAFALTLLPFATFAVELADKPPSVQASHADDLQGLIQDFREQNAEYLEARRQLRQQLAETYDPEERRALIRAFIREYGDQINAQRDLRRAFRQAHMDLRRERRGDRPRRDN